MNRSGPVLRFLFYSAGMLILLAACQGETAPQATPFVPPTVAAQVPVDSSVRPVLTEAPRPTTVPSCMDSLSFFEDLTIPDGTVVTPGQRLDKRWKVSNSGSCNWDEHYRLKLIAGPSLGAPEEQALYPARSGMDASIRVMFQAPAEPGTYRSAWQAYSPKGEPFGDVIYVEVVVAAPTQAP